MSQLQRSLNSSSVAELLTTYDTWAEDYNRDVQREEYTAPQLASYQLAQLLGSDGLANAKILDAGCGTGLVGECLVRHGARNICGIDLSPGMLAIAKKTGAYVSLDVANLVVPLELKSQTYDAVICVGTLTAGHVGPDALDELVRVTKSAGYIVATVRDSVWEGKGFKTKIQGLVDSGQVALTNGWPEKQSIGTDVFAYLISLRVL